MATPKIPTPESDAQAEKFIRLLLGGKTRQAAYRDCFPEEKKRDIRTINRQSLAYFNRPAVQVFYHKLKEDLDKLVPKETLWSRDLAVATLRDLITKSREQYDRSKDIRGVGPIIIQAINTLNKMFGYEEPDKTDNNAPVPVAFNFVPVKKPESDFVPEVIPDELKKPKESANDEQIQEENLTSDSSMPEEEQQNG